MKKILINLKTYQWIIISIAIIVNIFIIVNSCLPANESSQQSGWVVSLLTNIINGVRPNTINESNINEFSSFIRKFIGHFSLFLVSGIFSSLSVKYLYLNEKKNFLIFTLISCSIGLFLAILTEIIQLFVPGRSGEFKDVMTDFSGYLISFLIVSLIIYFTNKKTSNIENNNEKE